jgi:large subunit ribosomal protein L10
MPNKAKQTFVAELTEELKKSPHVLVTDYQGMKAEQFNELRANLNKVGAKYKVLKNRLARLAFKNIGWESLSDDMKGPSAIAYFGTDGAAVTKILQDFSTKNKNFKVKAGHLYGMRASAQDLKTIAGLPSREVLLATLLSRMNSPLITLLATLNEPVRSLHGALSAIAKKKESAPAAPAAPAA